MFHVYEQIRRLLFIIEKKFIVFIPLLSLFLFSSFLDLLSLGIIAPYIQFVMDPEMLFDSGIADYLPFTIHDYEAKEIFIYFSIFIIVVFVFKSFFSILIRMLIRKFELKNLENLQVRLITAYQNMNYSDFIGRNSSDYIRNIRELSGDCMNSLGSGLRVVSEAIVLIAITIYLLTINPLALVSLASIVFISMFFYNTFLKPKTIRYGENKVEATKLIYQGVDESIKGFKEIRILKKQNFFVNLVRKGAKEIFQNDLKTSLILYSPRYFLELIVVVFIIVFFTVYSLLENDTNNIFPLMGVFAVAGLRVIPSASIISNGLLMINYTNFAINILYLDLKKYKKKEKDNNEIKSKNTQEDFNSIKLEKISFKYPNSNQFIFKDLDFSVNHKDCIGIIGKNGSGKTTLVDILLGLLVPQSGKIFINNSESNIKSFNWSKKIAYLPQEHLILNNSIKKNIALEVTENIDKDKINRAIKQANLESLIKDLPNGLDTLIGENGIRLSGGQYKKIALARLFYHEKDILILDEATNSLDKKSEEMIVEEINQIKGHKTIIVITHNLNTLKHCEKIYKIENHKILKNELI